MIVLNQQFKLITIYKQMSHFALQGFKYTFTLSKYFVEQSEHFIYQ